MTSACIFKDTLWNDTQVFLKIRDSLFLVLFTSHQLELHFLLPTFIDAEQRRGGNIKGNPAPRKWIITTRKTNHFLIFSFLVQLLDQEIYSIPFIQFNVASNTSIDSTVSDVFFVEQISNEPSPQGNNSPNILNSTAISHTHTARMPSVSSIASPEPQI